MPSPLDDATQRAMTPRGRSNRRQFLQRAALLTLGTAAAPILLEACSTNASQSTAPTLKLASPHNPVTWDIAGDNRPIADGLAPEAGATLQVYSYADYVSPDAIAAFESKYHTSVRVSTFNSTDEALTKIRSGDVDFDLYFPGYDQMGRLVLGGLIAPLNHSYIPNIDNVWPVFTNPWYDQQWRYSTPYTVYSTGIGWRTDQVSDVAALPNPYDALWDPRNKGKVAIIDDWHTAMAMVLLRNGIDDVNTTSAADLELIGKQLKDMTAATSPRVTTTMYSELPEGQIGVSQMWSGDVINAAKNYLPQGTDPAVLGYWFPASGHGLIDNDLMVVLRHAKSPVLAHLFINHMLDPASAMQNFTQIGYQPPQNSLNVDALVSTGFIPKNLASAIVRPADVDNGLRLLELDPANDTAWHNVWQQFSAGAS